jgi:hypothetical protein
LQPPREKSQKSLSKLKGNSLSATLSALLSDVQRIIQGLPDTDHQKALHAGPFLFGICTGSRSITSQHVISTDIKHVIQMDPDKTLVRMVLRVTKGDPHLHNLISIDGNIHQADNFVYWLNLHLKLIFSCCHLKLIFSRLYVMDHQSRRPNLGLCLATQCASISNQEPRRLDIPNYYSLFIACAPDSLLGVYSPVIQTFFQTKALLNYPIFYF